MLLNYSCNSIYTQLLILTIFNNLRIMVHKKYPFYRTTHVLLLLLILYFVKRKSTFYIRWFEVYSNRVVSPALYYACGKLKCYGNVKQCFNLSSSLVCNPEFGFTFLHQYSLRSSLLTVSLIWSSYRFSDRRFQWFFLFNIVPIRPLPILLSISPLIVL